MTLTPVAHSLTHSLNYRSLHAHVQLNRRRLFESLLFVFILNVKIILMASKPNGFQLIFVLFSILNVNVVAFVLAFTLPAAIHTINEWILKYCIIISSNLNRIEQILVWWMKNDIERNPMTTNNETDCQFD